MLGGDTAAVVFGLASALSWGAGDFSGGLATKRAPVFGVLAIGHTVGLLLLIVLALVWGEPLPAAADLGWGLAAGLAGAVGLAALYRALAIGQMGMVAPLSAVLTAALPALFGVLSDGLPGARTLAGFGLALLAIWLVAGTGAARGARDGLGLAVLAGCAFGLFFILVHRAGASAVFWPLVAARIGSLGLVLPIAIGRRQLLGPDRQLLVPVLLSGALDVAGNACFVLAGQAGRLDVAAILASLYPASTVLLAALLLGERVLRVQVVGIVAALAAIALIAT
ncbi:MAG: DMT family transporter [Kouleothrix sp.]|nr:DMT family transporter [Kouleothrix sp.]